MAEKTPNGLVINQIDEFRRKFFENMIKEEKEKERQLKQRQLQCFHNYSIVGLTNEKGYQERTCSKCGHSTLRSLQVWQGTPHSSCIIA